MGSPETLLLPQAYQAQEVQVDVASVNLDQVASQQTAAGKSRLFERGVFALVDLGFFQDQCEA